jgi:assimilatory nitrate reductase catalytic subunit
MRVTSRRGSIALRARITEAIAMDTVFAPFHWGGDATVNDLIGGTLDPHSKMPPFKACAVRIEPESGPTTR